MKKETQDRLWAVLTAEEREGIIDAFKSEAINADYERGWNFAVRSIFGEHNLKSDEEPELQPTPRFKMGDMVRIISQNTARTNEVAEIVEIIPSTINQFPYGVKGIDVPWRGWYKESDLAPHTEPEPNKQNDMEETNNELNLAELLKDALEEEFWSPMFGDVKLSHIDLDDNKPLVFNWKDGAIYTRSNGVMYNNTLPIIFPSKDLYEKHPLDAKAAWSEWAESRKPKRWRAKDGEHYYRFDLMFPSILEVESGGSVDNTRYEWGNYFQTRGECVKAAEAVRKFLQEFHEKNAGK